MLPDDSNPYLVETTVYRGPLDLLLSLIEQRKLFINDISLASVADDFIAYIKTIEHFPVAQTAHFILIASTLVLIKSRSLLPSLELSSEESADIADLEHRLALHKKNKEAAYALRGLLKNHALYPRVHIPHLIPPSFTPDRRLQKTTLLSALRRVLVGIPKQTVVPQAVVTKIISLEAVISSLRERLAHGFSVSFQAYSKEDRAEKADIIVKFLALLELAKEGIISVRQQAQFGDIMMESESLNVPRYG